MIGITPEASKEIQEKEKRIQEYMANKKLDGIILNRSDNWAWITGGRNDRIIYTTEYSMMYLIITKDLKKYCITPNVESNRLEIEDLGDIDYKIYSFPWYDDSQKEALFRKIIKDKKFASDVESINGVNKLDEDFNRLRFSLTENEIIKYRQLGKWCRESIEDTARSIEKGITEQEISGIAIGKLGMFGIFPHVLMVGSDERIFNFRHPLTTNKKVKKYVIIVLCGSKWGLVLAMSRLVHFGEISKELNNKMKKVTEIEAKLIANSRPGKSFSDISKVINDSYEKAGYPDMWKLHYQGGPIGYNVREYSWTPDNDRVFYDNQAIAWNPTITGVKSEDTFISMNGNIEFISYKKDKSWPFFEHNIYGHKIFRPSILIK